jgi:hypothetical protein
MPSRLRSVKILRMKPEDAAPNANRSAVQLALVGGIGILASASIALNIGAPVFADALVFVVLPVVLIVAGIRLAVGSKYFGSVVGPSRLGRILFIAWAVSTAVSQMLFLGEFGDIKATTLEVETIRQVVSLVAAATGILAGVIILNSGPRTLARGSLIFGVALYALSESLLYAQMPAIGGWWGVPLAIGQLLIGISYLHSGLSDAAPVPEGAESLAE